MEGPGIACRSETEKIACWFLVEKQNIDHQGPLVLAW